MNYKIYTLREIADYIIKNYPDCCLAYNDKNYNYSEESLIYELDDFFSYELIGLCGCGNPDEVKKDIRDLLNIVYEHYLENNLSHHESYEKYCESIMNRFGCRSFYDNSLLAFMVYILNDKDILEHGSSIGSSWLTEIGEMCRQVYNKYGFEKKEEEERIQEDIDAEQRKKFAKIFNDADKKFREENNGNGLLDAFEENVRNAWKESLFFSHFADIRNIEIGDKNNFEIHIKRKRYEENDK